MPDGRDILREWQDAMQSIAGAARGAAGRSELPKALLTPMQRQLELVQAVVERERNLQAEVFGQLLDPIDAVLDLLEESGMTFRAQAEALEQASAALEQTAVLMQRRPRSTRTRSRRCASRPSWPAASPAPSRAARAAVRSRPPRSRPPRRSRKTHRPIHPIWGRRDRAEPISLGV